MSERKEQIIRLKTLSNFKSKEEKIDSCSRNIIKLKKTLDDLRETHLKPI